MDTLLLVTNIGVIIADIVIIAVILKGWKE